MNFLPYESFELYTKLSADEVFYRLRANVDTKRKWLFFTNKPYWGKVEREYFKIWRSTWWNQRLRCVVIGSIHTRELGSYVSIKMRNDWYSFIFWLIWLTCIWVVFFERVSNLIILKLQTGFWENAALTDFLFLIIMFIFGYGISVGFFMWEVQDIKKRLFQLLETNEGNMKVDEKILGLTEPQILKLIFSTTLVLTIGWVVYNLLLMS